MNCAANYLAIVDVLGTKDHPTGDKLYEKLAAPGGAPIDVSRYATKTRSGLFKALELLGDRAIQDNLCPLVHIEGHGSPGALYIGDGEEKVRWSELSAPLRRINVAVRNSVVVVLAACHGMWLIDAIRPLEPAPFVGLIAPNDVVNPASFVQGFPEFYRVLFEQEKYFTALLRLRGFGLPEYYAYDAATVFAKAWRKYVKQAADPAEREDRAEYLVGSLENSTVEALGGSETAKARAEAAIVATAAQREEAWRTFTMSDIYPENSSRFAYALVGDGA